MLQMVRKKRLKDEAGNDYATHSDFCGIFREHMVRLYLLAFILTGNERSAEKCFLDAFESCAQERLVFRDRALYWSRRSIIKTAVRLASPVPPHASGLDLVGKHTVFDLDQEISLNCVHKLPPGERFVFVMSVLERYSIRECAILLGCSDTDIVAARIRALRQISKLKKSYPDHSSGAQPYVVDPDWLECG